MQVDGEACRLLPSIITLSMLNKATMLAKRRSTGKPQQNTAKLERLKLPVMKIRMSDYETNHHDKEKLKEVAELWVADPLDLDAATDLESLRKILAKDRNMDSCCFLDCECCCFRFENVFTLERMSDRYSYLRVLLACTAERFFRIDRGQEQLHYVTDVAVDAVYVLDEDAVPQSKTQPAQPSQVAAGQENAETTQTQARRYAFIYYLI